MNGSIVLLAAALLATAVVASPQNMPSALQPSDPPRVLSAFSRIKFEIPMFGSSGRDACDSAGDLVFNVGGGVFNKGPFLRVRSDGRQHVIYSLPSQATGKGNIAWAMTPEGTFYVLHEDFKDYQLVRFNDDGSVMATTNLDVPAGVDIWFLAVTNNGTVFARGYQDRPDPRDQKRVGFTALFDGSGKMIRNLSSTAPEFDLAAVEKHPLNGDAVAGEDGRFYILEDKKVLVLNLSGETQTELNFKKPVADGSAVRVDYSQGLISILFHSVHRTKSDQPADVEVRAILLNAQTGEQQGSYVFDPSTTGSVLCFNAQEGYSLMAMDGKMAAKDVVPIR
jgi:hypothetical protein